MVRSPFHPFRIARPEILRVVADDRRAEGGHGAHHKVDQFVRRTHSVLRGVSRNERPAGHDIEFHRFGKHDDQPDRQNGELQPERQSLFEMRRNIPCSDLKVRFSGTKVFIFYKDIAKARDGAESLRQNGRSGGTRHAPTEPFDKQNIEPDIHHGGDQKKKEGSKGIADTP